MQVQNTSTEANPRTWLWPAGIVGLLAIHMLAMGVVVFVATRDPSFAVEPQAYKKAVAWDSSQAQRQASERLGWTAQIQTSESLDMLGRRRVTCHLVDANRIPVMAATVKLEAFHHARATERFHVTLNPQGDSSYSAELPMRRAGTWEFRISALRGAEAFTFVTTHQVGGRS